MRRLINLVHSCKIENHKNWKAYLATKSRFQFDVTCFQTLQLDKNLRGINYEPVNLRTKFFLIRIGREKNEHKVHVLPEKCLRSPFLVSLPIYTKDISGE